MRTQTVVLVVVAMVLGAVAGTLMTPQPAGGVSKEIIELQQQVQQVLQSQRDMRSAMDTNQATLRTLVQQSLDSINAVNREMGALQKVVQDSTANGGARIDTMTTQTQGLADNVQDIQARVGKLSQQLGDMQNLLQGIDGKISGGGGGAPPSGGSGGSSNLNAPNPTAPSPISSETLYQNALRDFGSGKYDLARQEFSDYLKNFPSNDLAGNAQFYLGEIFYAQNNFQDAVTEYDKVLYAYPKSYKVAAALLKKGQAEVNVGQKATGIRDLREVTRRFPGTPEAKQAAAKLKDLEPKAAPSRSSR